MSIHVVSQGETIADIAAEYGVSPNRLSFDNQLSEQDHLVAGQALLVLQPDVIHETARGETIPSIAARYWCPSPADCAEQPLPHQPAFSQTRTISGHPLPGTV